MTATTSRRGRRLAGLAGLLGAAVLLVAGKAASASAPTKVDLGAPQPAPTPAPAPSGSPGGTPPAAPTTSASTPAGRSGTFLGQPEDVGYGTVQVKVTLSQGRIADVQAVQMPSGGRSSDIATYAAPQLRKEVLAAQSANIDTVSGASYDSEGYAKSVQSVLDSAPR